jgi:hypothetical protein
MSVEMEDIPQTTVSADDYLMSSQIGDDDLDIDIPNDDFVSVTTDCMWLLIAVDESVMLIIDFIRQNVFVNV